jgi:hypothetical protein
MIAGNMKLFVVYIVQVGIAFVWIVAAAAKARTPPALRKDTVRRLVGGPDWAVSVIARGLPLAECALGVWLITRWKTTVAAAISATVFLLFAFLVGRAAIRDAMGGTGCGCFGVTSRQARPAYIEGPKAVARNFLLANLSVILALAGRCACT